MSSFIPTFILAFSVLKFQGNVEKCREAEVRFHGEELKIYGERMTILQKAYNELLVLSNKRVSDLHTLHDFMQVKD